jgi:hypothetical protein
MAITYDERRAWERALVRLAEQPVEVLKAGVSASGTTMWLVSSRTTVGRWYTVTQEGGQLSCTCLAAKEDIYCCHRAAVRLALIREQAVEAAEDARQEGEAPDRWVLTVRGRRALAELRARQAATTRRSTCEECGQLCDVPGTDDAEDCPTILCAECLERAMQALPDDVRHLIPAPAPTRRQIPASCSHDRAPLTSRTAHFSIGQ